MEEVDFELVVRVMDSCINENCLMSRYYYHTVELYNLCTHCGWKWESKDFIPELYSGDDWTEEEGFKHPECEDIIFPND